MVTAVRSKETLDQAMERMYALAQKRGLHARALDLAAGTWIVTSSREGAMPYEVDVCNGLAKCACPGYAKHQYCTHAALALTEAGRVRLAPVMVKPITPIRPETLAAETDDMDALFARVAGWVARAMPLFVRTQTEITPGEIAWALVRLEMGRHVTDPETHALAMTCNAKIPDAGRDALQRLAEWDLKTVDF